MLWFLLGIILLRAYLLEIIQIQTPSVKSVLKLFPHLSTGTVQDHLKMLAELLPDWLELLPWTQPHMRLSNLKRSLAQVRAFLNEKLQEPPPADS